jgi:peroxiredoxin
MKLFLFSFLFFLPSFLFSQGGEDSTIIWQKNHYQDTLAPKFYVTDTDGKTWNSDSLRGKVVVLNFWSIYCPGCFMELPELNKLPAQFSSDSVIFISILFEKGERADSVIAKNKFAYHLVEDGLQVHGDFYNNCYPTHIIIDRKGIIRYNVCGVVNVSMLLPEIEKSVSEK